MEIVAFDTDERADGDTTINNGKAKITWISKSLLNMRFAYNTDNKTYSSLGTTIQDALLPLIPNDVSNSLVQVKKKYSANTSDASAITIGQKNFYVWIPSRCELFGGTATETSHAEHYSTAYPDDRSRIKKLSGVATTYWTRSRGISTYAYSVGSDGKASQVYRATLKNVSLGFCT